MEVVGSVIFLACLYVCVYLCARQTDRQSEVLSAPQWTSESSRWYCSPLRAICLLLSFSGCLSVCLPPILSEALHLYVCLLSLKPCVSLGTSVCSTLIIVDFVSTAVYRLT